MASGLGGIFQQLISPTKYPVVPAAPYVNPQQAQLQTTQGNIAALPGLESLATGVNQFNLGQNTALAKAAIPGFENLIGTESANIENLLHGVISPDTSNAIFTNMAQHGITSGVGGNSGIGQNQTALSLGETSQALQTQGSNELPGYLKTIQSLLMPAPFQVQSGMLTPQQDIATQQWNEQNRYQQQGMQNVINALPDPLMQAVGSFVGDTTNQFVNMAEMAGTGGMLSGIGTGGSSGAGSSWMGSIFGPGPNNGQAGNSSALQPWAYA